MTGQHAARGCLYHTALLPRTIGTPVSRHGSPATDRPHRGERGPVALAAFDGIITRTEILVAHLHRNGHDTSTLSSKLRQLRSLRRDLSLAFTIPKGRQPGYLQDELEMTVKELCFLLRSQKQGTDHARYCHNAPGGDQGPSDWYGILRPAGMRQEMPSCTPPADHTSQPEPILQNQSPIPI
jgi:hypothetical protein